MKRFVLILLLSIPVFLHAQDQTVLDSLQAKLQNISEDGMKVKILLEISEQYNRSDFSKAMAYSSQAMEFANESKDDFMIASSYIAKGNTFLWMGNYNESLKSYLKGLEMFESIQNKVRMIGACTNLGLVYDRIENYDMAIKYYFKALNLYNEQKALNKPLEKFSGIISLYNNIGNIYENKDNNETAIQYYKKGLKLALEKEDYFRQGVVYNNLGKIYLKLERFDEAEDYLQTALKVRERNQDKAGMAKSYYFLGAYYLDLKDYKKALEHSKKSLELGKDVGSLETQQVAASFLYQIYDSVGQFDKAYQTHKLYKTVSDSLMNEKTIREMTRAQIQFDFDKAEKIKQMEQRRKELYYVLLISVLVLGVIIFGLFYTLQKSKTKQVRIQKDNAELKLENLNKKLTTNVMFLMKKNELIRDISTKLISLKAKVAAKNQLPVQKIIFELNSLSEEDAWEEFELRFQEVHSQFYENLNREFPDLTPGERKLCAFLRLNMTTKEIASVIHQSPKSIDVARTRLRKKLNLTNKEVNLITFLTNI